MELSEPFVIKPTERDVLDLPHHYNMEAKELVNPEHGSSNAVFRLTTIEPGKKTVDDWHHHETSEQLVYVLSGKGAVSLSKTGDEDDKEVIEISENSFIFIPPNVYHDIWSTGNSPLEMIIVWTPPYDSYDDWDTKGGQ